MRRLCLLLLLLPALAACQWMTEDFDDNTEAVDSSANQYINLTISVGSGHQVTTRAVPAGGENGDGREAGFERENVISGITFILADGPLGSSTAKVQYVRYFPVFRGTALDPGATTSHSHTDGGGEEVIYTTGDCLVDDFDLRENKDYHVIVLANCYVAASVGDNLSDIQDQTLSLSALCQRTGTSYVPDNYNTFAMASEQDVVINFGGGTGVTQTSTPNSVTYTVNRAIIIERLAARIDYCSNYAGGTKTAPYGIYDVKVNGEDATVKGYKYDVDDYTYFVLESIIPFNLFDEQEYFFKRVRADWGTSTPNYLAEETASNFVADPKTNQKTATAMNYINSINTAVEPSWLATTPYYRSCESMNAQTATSKLSISSHLTGDGDKSNVFVLAYAMENTLMPASPLKTYATGLVLTGSYYDATTNSFLTRKTHYGFLRHQGETRDGSGPYPTYEWSELNSELTGAAAVPMNFSIVRNNIYRVSIDQVSAIGRLQLRMAVHDWRNVWNPEIFI